MMRMLVPAVLVLVAIAASSAAQTSKASGPAVNPLTDANVYPIAVWAMGARTAPAFAELGVNIFVGESGDARTWCDAIAKSGCAGFVHWRQRTAEEAAAIAGSPGFLGWMHGDEPDNPGEVNGEFRSTQIPPSELIARYQAMKAGKTPAPMYLNLGQGLANANWQSTPDDLYKEFMKCADIVCYDIYPTSTMPDGANRLALVARGIARLKAFAGDRPAWIWLECTNMPADKADVGERAPTPHELRAEVWMSVLHGADAIGYFPHQFNPYKGGPAAIPADLQKEMKLTNGLLHKLAPLLRKGKKQILQSPAGDGRVDAAMWSHGSGTLVLAVNMKNASAKAEIKLPVGPRHGAFSVIGQDRTVQPNGNVIAEDFQPYEVRLYWSGPKIEGVSYAHPAPPAARARTKPADLAKLADLPEVPEAGKGMAWSRTHCTRLDCPVLASAPAIDGNLRDMAWTGARKLLNWSNVGGTGVAAQQTVGMIGQHEGKVYLAFRCLEPSLDKLVTGKKAGWQNDCIEIWFDPTNTRLSYCHIVVTADGQVEASRTIPDKDWMGEGTRDDAWKPAIQVKTGREKDAWTVEMSIDIKDLQVPGGKGTLWGFNVARERKPGGGENSMYACGGFNKSFRFVELSMDPSPISLANGVLANRSDKPVTAKVEVVVSRKQGGVIFADWEAKWTDLARETLTVQLAPGMEFNLLDLQIRPSLPLDAVRGGGTEIVLRDWQFGQKVPSGGRLRVTVLEPKGAAAMEEFIANPKPDAEKK